MINNADKIVLALNIATRQKLQVSNERRNIQVLNWEINTRLYQRLNKYKIQNKTFHLI